MPFTFADLKAEIRGILWPAGLDEQENLIVAHDKLLIEGLVEIQRWVDCFQYNNTQLFRACSRFYKCGLNVMEQPVSSESLRSIASSIRRLSVIDQIDPVTKLESAAAPDQWCSQIFYEQVEYCRILAYQQQVRGCSSCGGFANFSGLFGFPAALCGRGDYPTPDDAEYLSSPGLPLGHHYQPQASTNAPRRAYRGVWAVERGRIYIAPWLQSTETVIVEWDGIKNLWDDLDLVENNAQLKRTLRYYVLWNHLKDYGTDYNAAAVAERDYRNALSQLMRDCREETRVKACEGSNARQADIPIAAQGGPAGLLVPSKATLQHPVEIDGQDVLVQLEAACPDVAAPEFDPPAGAIVTFPTWMVITSATAGAEIFFTLDGSAPTRASTLYEGPFQIGAGIVVKAVAFLGQCGSDLQPGGVSEADYLDAALLADTPPTLTTLCTNTDRAGKWFNFHPDGSQDINWQLVFDFLEGETITRLELYETDANGLWTTGRCWATDYAIHPASLGGATFNSYPLVITENDIQLYDQYEASLGSISGTEHDWRLFGEFAGVTQSGKFYKLIIFRADGLTFYATADIVCTQPCAVNMVADDGSGIATVATGYGQYTLNFVFSLSEDGWIFSEVISSAGVVQVISPPLGSNLGCSPTIPVVIRVSILGVIQTRCFAFTCPTPTTTTTTSTTTTTTTTTTPCDDGYGLNFGCDIQFRFTTWRNGGCAATPLCEDSTEVECGVDDCRQFNTNDYTITNMTRATCEDAFQGTVHVEQCDERNGGILITDFTANFNPITGEFDTTDLCGQTSGIGGYTQANGDIPCESGAIFGARCVVTVS